MRTTNLALVAAIAAPVLSAASPGFLKLDVNKRRVQDSGRLFRRQNADGTVNAKLTQDPDKLEYLVNITVGTPEQKLAVTLDTGSSDLWIPALSSTLCNEGKCDEGSFAPNKSNSYAIVDKGGFNITYAGPGDSDAGDWATDTITVGGSSSITEQQIGVALDGFDPHGVMGIGFDTNEANNPSQNGVYPSVMDNLVTQGIIQRKAYSLYLNDLQANAGAILFGGVDTTKYTGDLIVLPLQYGPNGYISEFYVTLTSVSFTDPTGSTTQLSPEGYGQAVLLDSGTSATLLTDDIFTPLAQGFGAIDVGDETYAVPCKYGNLNGSINYVFGGDGGVTVTVPISQIVGNQYFSAVEWNDASGGCDFGFGPPIDGVSILGDTFLRSAYAVFDLENNVAALAQAAENQAEKSSISVIPTGTEIPGATMTAIATGTQLTGDAATSIPPIPSASGEGSTVFAGTPTFNLGSSATGGAGGSSSSGGAQAFAPTAALLVLGLAAGAFAW